MVIGIFDNEFVKCELDDSLPVLIHRWKSELPGEEFKYNLRRVLEEYQNLKKSYKRLAWLADTVKLGELDEDVEEWLVNTWEDLIFKKAEVKIHAVILGQSILPITLWRNLRPIRKLNLKNLMFRSEFSPIKMRPINGLNNN
jgi:hypothetical protein